MAVLNDQFGGQAAPHARSGDRRGLVRPVMAAMKASNVCFGHNLLGIFASKYA
jgi:hypothetical protein